MAADVYARFVSAQCLTLCELLEAFPSCKPRPGTLLALLPPLPPRYYSVACSQLATPGSVSVAFSVASRRLPHPINSGSAATAAAAASLMTCPELASEQRAGAHGETGFAVEGGDVEEEGCVVRCGLCTNWLEEILAPLLEQGGVSADGGRRAVGKGVGIFVPLFVKPTKEFLLPASAKWPCVLIGPGTG